jgi:hypothetical protein
MYSAHAPLDTGLGFLLPWVKGRHKGQECKNELKRLLWYLSSSRSQNTPRGRSRNATVTLPSGGKTKFVFRQRRMEVCLMGQVGMETVQMTDRKDGVAESNAIQSPISNADTEGELHPGISLWFIFLSKD